MHLAVGIRKRTVGAGIGVNLSRGFLWIPTAQVGSDGLREGQGTMLEAELDGGSGYQGKFYKTKLKKFIHIVNVKLASCARRKYKNLRASEMKAIRWLHGVTVRQPILFAHWALLGSKPTI